MVGQWMRVCETVSTTKSVGMVLLVLLVVVVVVGTSSSTQHLPIQFNPLLRFVAFIYLFSLASLFCFGFIFSPFLPCLFVSSS